MSELFINKKIDSLGRIVIPKEIRKKLHIIENESLDITLDNEKVIIKKTNDDLYNKRLLNIIVDILKKALKKDVNIFNINEYYYNDNNIRMSNEDFKRFMNNQEKRFNEYQLFPIYPNGTLYGALLVEKKIDETSELNILKCFQRFIEKYLEE